MNFEPVIKWSGSKRSQSEFIVSKIKDKEYDTYYEPFCGGCSVLFQVLNSEKKFKRYVCSDVNSDLISLWNLIKSDPDLISLKYEEMWNELNYDNDIDRKRDYFNNVRNRFNKYKNPTDFMFIMRTTTNGMPRYNRNGEFNNSFHITRSGIRPEKLKKILNKWSLLLNKYNVDFLCCNYDEIKVKQNDFMYLDPPYANTSGMYYGTINYDKLWDFMRNLECEYILSFDGKTEDGNGCIEDMTFCVPSCLYSQHLYIDSGNSSFRRIIKKSNKTYVKESLYIK